MGACGINAGNNEVGADVALVAEQMLLQHGHACYDAGLAAGGEGMQFEIRGDDGSGEFRVRGGTGAGAPDVRGDVVEFLAVLFDVSDGRASWVDNGYGGEQYLVCDYGPACGSGVCCNDDAAVEETAHNGGSRACGLWQRDALGVEGRIAVVVGEVEAAHGAVVGLFGDYGLEARVFGGGQLPRASRSYSSRDGGETAVERQMRRRRGCVTQLSCLELRRLGGDPSSELCWSCNNNGSRSALVKVLSLWSPA